MNKPLSIAVAGCGIAGLSAAILLNRQGHRISLFDQFAQPLPVGSGLVIQPVGQAVLAELGVLDAALAQGAQITRMVGYVSGGKGTALDARYDAGGKGRFGLALHRSVLFGLLLERALAEGVEITQSARVLRAEMGVIHLESGASRGLFDLVIDAAGAQSALSPQPGKHLPYGAIWASVDWPEGVAEHGNELRQTYLAARHMLGVLPIGRMNGSSTRKAAIFWSLRQESYADWLETPLDEWKAQAAALWPDFAPFLTSITDHGQMTMARYRHGTLRSPVAGNVVHIGDAWHVASPQLGQGANMALLDALALSVAVRGHGDLNAALAAFHGLRRRHLALYQLASRLLTPLYQSDSRVLPLLRDYVLTPASKLKPARVLVGRLVCGDLIPPLASRVLQSLPASSS
jgi:2-polyprenyl-6-methoxyphenol hydroxylase-like FAD-dependent oxidoreductase